MNILVVDDEPAYRELLKTSLKIEGWDVVTAADGLEGLERLRETKIDCIISDVYMPNMDGLKFHDRVRETPEYTLIPFLFVSGYGDQATLIAITKTKNDGFFQKTQPLRHLKEWIRYLTTPESKRPPLPPDGTSTPSHYERSSDRPQRRR